MGRVYARCHTVEGRGFTLRVLVPKQYILWAQKIPNKDYIL